MDTVSKLQGLGPDLPGPGYLFGMIVFSLVGLVAWRHGRRAGHRGTLWLRVALMVYPYAVSAAWMLYAVGAALCAGLFFAWCGDI